MAELCRLYSGLPGEQRRLVLAEALATYIGGLLEQGRVAEAVELAARAAGRGLLPRGEAERLAALLAARRLVDALNALAEAAEKLSPAELRGRLRSILDRAAEAGVPRHYPGLWDAAREAATALLSYAEARERLAEIQGMMQRLAGMVSEALEDINAALRLAAGESLSAAAGAAASAVDTLRRAAAYAEEIVSTIHGTRLAEQYSGLLGDLERTARHVGDLALALAAAAEELRGVLAKAAELREIVHRIASGAADPGSPEVARQYRAAVEWLAASVRSLRSRAEQLRRTASGDTPFDEAARRLAELLEQMADTVYAMLAEHQEAVAGYDPLYRVFRAAVEEAGLQLPPPERPRGAAGVYDRLRRWLQWLEAGARRLEGSGSGLLGSALAALAATAAWFSYYTLGLPAGLVETARARLAQLRDILSGRLSEAARKELELLRGMLPQHLSAPSLAGYAASILALGYLARTRLGKPLELAFRAALPELELLLRAYRGLRGAEKLAVEEIARSAEIARVPIRGVVEKRLPEASRAFAEALARQGLDRRYAEALARELAENIAREGDILRALEKLRPELEKLKPLDIEATMKKLDAVMERIRGLSLELPRLAEELPRLRSEEYLARASERLAAAARELEALYAEARRLAGELRELLGPLAPRELAALEKARPPAGRLLELAGKLEQLREALGRELAEAKAGIYQILYGCCPRYAEMVRQARNITELEKAVREAIPRLVEAELRRPTGRLAALMEAWRRSLERLSRTVLELGPVAEERVRVALRMPEEEAARAIYQAGILTRDEIAVLRRHGVPVEKGSLEELARLAEQLRGKIESSYVVPAELAGVARIVAARLEELARIARGAGLEEAAKRAASAAEVLREAAREASVKLYALQRLRGMLRRLRGLAERLGDHELARLVDEAVKALGEGRVELGKILGYVRERYRGRPEELAELGKALGEAAEGLPAPVKQLVTEFLETLRQLMEEARGAGEVRAVLERRLAETVEASPETLRALLDLFSRERRYEIETPYGRYTVTRRAWLEGNRAVLEYRVEDSRGHYIVYRLELVFREADGTRYVDTAETIIMDPETAGERAEAVPLLLREAIEGDRAAGAPAAELLRRVYIRTPGGPEPLAALVTPLARPHSISPAAIALRKELDRIALLLANAEEVSAPPTITRRLRVKPLKTYKLDKVYILVVDEVPVDVEWFRVNVGGVELELPGFELDGGLAVLVPSAVAASLPEVEHGRPSLPSPGSPPSWRPAPPPALPPRIALAGAGARGGVMREVLLI